jgi:riboflavin synthase
VFTGIVEHLGRVVSVSATASGRRLTISAGPCAEGLRPGASLAINGVCLTATERNGDALAFDVIAETLRRSNLGDLAAGDHVNLERSLRVGDRIDGHFVQGHVDGRARLERRQTGEAEFKLWFRPDRELEPYIVPKGAIALDGVSLTIADLSESSFSVALTPTTLERTTLGRLQPGDAVNVETDLVARIVVHQLQRGGSGRGVDWAMLAEHGFLEAP